MSYIPSKERARVIRKALNREFGRQNVKVHKGRGTASSWVHAHIILPKPLNCINDSQSNPCYGSCKECRNYRDTQREFAKKVSNEAMMMAGYEHSIYYFDDGFGSKNEEFILDVNLK